MHHCWTCGSPTGRFQYTCSACQQLRALHDIYDAEVQTSQQLALLSERQAGAHRELSESISEGFARVANAMEWGFTELSWELQQQTSVLRSIEKALHNPAQVKGNECRRLGEELARRGDLDHAVDQFQLALNAYPIDYRIYVGLGHVYLRLERLEDARRCFEDSIRHAPHGMEPSFDHRSYSMRLVARTFASEGEFPEATRRICAAIDNAPEYPEALFEFAEYGQHLNTPELWTISLPTFERWRDRRRWPNHATVQVSDPGLARLIVNWTKLLRSRDTGFLFFWTLGRALEAKPMYFYRMQPAIVVREANVAAKTVRDHYLQRAKHQVEALVSQLSVLRDQVAHSLEETERARARAGRGSRAIPKDLKEGPSRLNAIIEVASDVLRSDDYLGLVHVPQFIEEDGEQLAKTLLTETRRLRDTY